MTILPLARSHEPRSRVMPKIPWILYLEGHGDLVSRLVMGITGVIIWLMGVMKLLIY